MRARIKEVMSAVFVVPTSQIDDATSKDDIEKWDSLGHMNLISALEEEFDITFDDEEILQMLTFQLIVEILRDKVNK